jgi:hypothetical protein
VGACDRALWVQVDPDPDTPTAVPTEEDAVQGCLVFPTQYGEGVETVQASIVSPDGECHPFTLPMGTLKPDMLAALATVSETHARVVREHGGDIVVYAGGGKLEGEVTLGELSEEGQQCVRVVMRLPARGGGLGKRGAPDAGASSSSKKPTGCASHNLAQLKLSVEDVYGQDGSGRIGGLPDGPISKADYFSCVEQWAVHLPHSDAFSNVPWPTKQRIGAKTERIKEGDGLIPTKMESIAGIPRWPACSISTLCEEGVRSAAAKAPKGLDGLVAKEYDLVFEAIAYTVELAAKVGVKPQYFAEYGDSFLAGLKTEARRHREAADEGASKDRFAHAMANEPPTGVAEAVVKAARNAQAGKPLPSIAAAARSSVARHARGAACGRTLREGATEDEKVTRGGWLLKLPNALVSREQGEDGQRKYAAWELLNPGGCRAHASAPWCAAVGWRPGCPAVQPRTQVGPLRAAPSGTPRGMPSGRPASGTREAPSSASAMWWNTGTAPCRPCSRSRRGTTFDSSNSRWLMAST